MLQSTGPRVRGLQWFLSIGSVAVVHGLSCPVSCGIFLEQGRTCVLCTGRRILNHWTTREVQVAEFDSLSSGRVIETNPER